jgi:acyl-CoA reductase-like NAD-dependent aldehyde dehydrogenase
VSINCEESSALDDKWIIRSQELPYVVKDFVGGGSRPGGGVVLTKESPRDGRLLYEFESTSRSNLSDVVSRARRAFDDGRWSGKTVQTRKDTLYRLAELIEEHREELALLESMDVGKPIHDAINIDIPSAVAVLRATAEIVDKVLGKVYFAGRSNLSYELRRPCGVVAGIVGWNYPLLLAARKVAPALVTGNSLILKPSEQTSLSASRLAQLALEAGVPEDVFNVVHGASVVGKTLADHNDVNLVTFTGSTATGKQLLIASGQSNMKRLILECGGKSPTIVFNDSPALEIVARHVVSHAFRNQGQLCTAGSRLLVQRDIKEELLACVVACAEKLVCGDPLRVGTRFGAVVSREHKDKVLGYINDAKLDGGELVSQVRGSDPLDGGFYISPIILDRISSTHRVAQEEIFGPVLTVMTFEDESGATRLANDTRYGLSAVVWTRDMGRAHRVSLALDSGWVVVNACANPGGGPSEGVMSIGGHKESGFGVEGGAEGLKAYTSHSAIQLFCPDLDLI